MRTQNGHNTCFKGKQAESPETGKTLKTSEEDFIANLKFLGLEELIHSLKMIHDFTLYQSDVCLGTREKNALFNIKVLWEGLEDLESS